MALETGTYISDLVPSNPTSTDGVGQTDDHLRLIKSVLQNTFPNITGPVTVTQGTINNPFPIGCIVMWSGTLATIPSGWKLCDGQTHARSDGAGNITTPDLRGKFIKATDEVTNPGTTGGTTSKTTTSNGAHTHTGTSGSAGGHTHGATTSPHTLTLSQIPSHTHGITTYWGSNGGNTSLVSIAISHNLTGASTTNAAGGGGAHSHGITTDGAHTHTVTVSSNGAHTHTISDAQPPYFELAFIMKI